MKGVRTVSRMRGFDEKLKVFDSITGEGWGGCKLCLELLACEGMMHLIPGG